MKIDWRGLTRCSFTSLLPPYAISMIIREICSEEREADHHRCGARHSRVLQRTQRRTKHIDLKRNEKDHERGER